MPASADAQGRIKCQECGNTLWFLTTDETGTRWISWNIHVRGRQIRPMRYPADDPNLVKILISCERCGAHWHPQPLSTAAKRPPKASGVVKPVSA